MYRSNELEIGFDVGNRKLIRDNGKQTGLPINQYQEPGAPLNHKSILINQKQHYDTVNYPY